MADCTVRLMACCCEANVCWGRQFAVGLRTSQLMAAGQGSCIVADYVALSQPGCAKLALLSSTNALPWEDACEIFIKLQLKMNHSSGRQTNVLPEVWKKQPLAKLQEGGYPVSATRRMRHQNQHEQVAFQQEHEEDKLECVMHRSANRTPFYMYSGQSPQHPSLYLQCHHCIFECID